MLKQLPYVLCFLALLSAAAFAQHSSVKVVFSPVPIWPHDGVIPSELGDRYVFLDPEAGQLVFAYPENLGSPDFERKPGARRLERIDLNDRVAVSVSVVVEPSGSDFRYSYRVSNDKHAAQPIRRFDMAVPEFGEGKDAIFAPANWSSAAGPIEGNAIQGAIGQPSSVLLSWYADDHSRVGQPQVSAIIPGTEREGFAVSSPLRPGFTTAYALGGVPPTLGSDIPSVVRRQAAPMLRRNGQPTLTIGPTFPAGAPMIEIVADFHLGISRLVRHGRLDAGSPAVGEALHVLKGYLEYMEAAYGDIDDMPLAKLAGPPLVFLKSPRDGLEAGILEAMKLSLVD